MQRLKGAPYAFDRVAWLTLAAGTSVTALVVWLLATTAAERDREAFESAAQQAQAAIEAKVETSVALLRATAGLFASATTPITVQRFNTYVERLALRERYPGLLAIAFAKRVPADEVAELEREMRAQGHEQFRLWPRRPAPELTAIVFIEPLDQRNQAAVGFDMASNPVRRAAMERARDTGSAAASGVVELVQEIDERKQPGFLIYLPVYDGRGTPATVAERRARLQGFAYAPIRAVDFLSGAFAYEASPGVGMAVYHGASADDGSLLYERPAGVDNPRHTRVTTIDVAGQPWTFVFRSRVERRTALLLPTGLALAGFALSLLLAVLVGRARRARRLAVQALDAERAARAEAEQANQAKDEFLATLSHELRTPLHAIIGWTSLLRQPQLAEEQRRMGIEVIDRNARTQSRLIEDLLDMNRIVSGKVTLDLAPVDLPRLVADAVKTITPTAEAKGIEVAARIEAQPATVSGDAGRLRQVILNILSNAVKFTPTAGRIDVSLERRDGMARLEVADTGEGIEAPFLERIFDRFAQVDASSTRRHGGLGLGLAIVRQLVALHGGTVRAGSDGPGKGSCFVVELPVVDASALAEEAAAAARPSQEQLRGLRILAVDDEADSRNLMQAVLTARGAQVCAVGSAREALAAFSDTAPDLILSDVAMPGMDGYELLRQIRALPARNGGHVPAAAITAFARDSDRRSALQAGFDMHLVKPLTPDSLVEAVLQLAGRAPTRPEEPERAHST